MKRYRILAGKPYPLGVTIKEDTVQFSLFSRNATSVSLLIFKNPQDNMPEWEIKLDPDLNRTGDIWHIILEDTNHNKYYLYRIEVPYDLAAGHRFNSNKLILDPYAHAVTGNFDYCSLYHRIYSITIRISLYRSSVSANDYICQQGIVFADESHIILILYNLMFIAPLVGIFSVAYYGVTSEQLAGFLQKNARAVKLLTSIFFFILASILLLTL